MDVTPTYTVSNHFGSLPHAQYLITFGLIYIGTE
jgi:hypothetical protein